MAREQAHISFQPGLRLEEQIYYDLLGRIQSGAYPQGSRLPTEKDFSEEFGVSRPVVRSALARLREAGLVVSRRGAGSFVEGTGIDHSHGFKSLTSIEDIMQYYKFRHLLEVETAAEAARKCTAPQARELDELQARMDRDIDAGQATIESDILFHAAIARISGNRFITESLELLQPHMRFVARFLRSLTPDGYAAAKQHLQAEHQAVIDALRANDPDAARRAMRDHIHSSEVRIFKGADNDV
ncbi:FadR/GntR family transcriptional regulator [Halovulum sp. GXIMD14794]